LVHRGVARAYPLWITDNYHVVNDRIGGDPVVFTTCERCQSGSAFLSVLGGERVKFSGIGMYNASLTLMNRGEMGSREGSFGLPYGHAPLKGKGAAAFVPHIPPSHPPGGAGSPAHREPDVMGAPSDRHPGDARHGHAREEYFSPPGMDLPLVATISGDLDDR